MLLLAIVHVWQSAVLYLSFILGPGSFAFCFTELLLLFVVQQGFVLVI